MRRPPRVAIAAVLLVGALAALFTVRVPAPPPAVAPTIKVMWAAGVTPEQQAARETFYKLTRQSPHGERTWNYELRDLSSENIRALVTDPQVQDTDGLDRRAFRLAVPAVTLAERLTAEVPALEALAGPGLRGWITTENVPAALLALAWLTLLALPSGRRILFHGVPPLSPVGLGLFRIVFGVALLVAVPAAAELPDTPFPRELHRPADWFANWEWVHRLAEHPRMSDRVLTAACASFVLFTAGVLPRITYAAGVAALTVRILVLLQHKSAHDWGLPIVALWALTAVPWHVALTLVPLRRRVQDDAPRYGYAIWIPGVVLGVGFLAAAWAKLDTSGWGWISGGAVKYHFIDDYRDAPVDWGLWIASRPAAAVMLSFAAVAAETLFIVHAFTRRPALRAAFACSGLLLLGGIYVFQGVFWPLWWVLFLAFLPWDSMSRQMDHPVAAATAPPFYTRAQLAVVALIVAVQIFASARRVEVEPFVSDYGMYSWTWQSTADFDTANARRYRAYRYHAVDRSGGELTDNLRMLPNATDALAGAIDRLREGQALEDEQREALRAVARAYESQFGEPLRSVRVLLDAQAFDWTRGRFYQKAAGAPVGVLGLDRGTLIAAS